jgi:FG-GAP-like repeat
MPLAAALVCALLALQLSSRPPDIPFAIHPIDLGASETAAVADINRDQRIDIVSGEYWYEAPALSLSKGPAWTKHRFRELGFSNNYVDNFSDLIVDVDADGYPDVVSVAWFAKKIAWWRNPGPSTSSGQAGLWKETAINTGFNVEFAILADVDNDGRAHEIVAQENGTGQSWYEIRNKAWVRHVVSDRTYGHGIGAGDVNGDKRHDILTPRGWLEAPADPRSGNWTFHSVWEAINVPATLSTGSGQAPSTGSGQAPAPPKPGVPPRVSQLGFMHVLDVNADGRNDVVTAAGHDYGVYWFEQGADGQWTRRSIDGAWSQGHASTLVDLNGDGQQDFVTGKRFMAHNGADPGEKEPLGVYWYERRRSGGALEWVRHIVDYGGRMGAGMQLPVADIDGDGDLDLVCPGKSGLFLVENLTRGPRIPGNRR